MTLSEWRVPQVDLVFLALAYHNAQLEASAFREEFRPESFKDLTLPKHEIIHKVRRDVQ